MNASPVVQGEMQDPLNAPFLSDVSDLAVDNSTTYRYHGGVSDEHPDDSGNQQENDNAPSYLHGNGRSGDSIVASEQAFADESSLQTQEYHEENQQQATNDSSPIETEQYTQEQQSECEQDLMDLFHNDQLIETVESSSIPSTTAYSHQTHSAESDPNQPTLAACHERVPSQDNGALTLTATDGKQQQNRPDDLLKDNNNEKPQPQPSSHHKGTSSLSQWMQDAADSTRAPIVPGQSLSKHIHTLTGHMTAPAPQLSLRANPLGNLLTPPHAKMPELNQPEYIPLPAGFTPTWHELVPNTQPVHTVAAANGPHGHQRKEYLLSLLNVKEFTIAGLAANKFEPSTVTSVTGLRGPIRKISRDHGRAVYQAGKWRIPLGAYHTLVAYLTSLPNCVVVGIPPHQLQIASLEHARQKKGFPTAQALVERDVPKGLAKALAPFQRGGVDFVLEKGGRALLADDMGLGKTIQAIASMSVYRNEWPLLVLSPSSARYHWENEFQNWLGADSQINALEYFNEVDAATDGMLTNDQIHVLTSSKDTIIPSAETKVVICSYGLVPALVQSRRIQPGSFRCAIVDESHMLKNKSSKRTSMLVPVLRACERCILLSGTPALARPSELYPQLMILRAEQYNWWHGEAEFMDKYVKKAGKLEKAELHTMLTGTVMIRRLKNDVLKSLPPKIRSKASLHVLNKERWSEFRGLLAELKTSNGAMGKIARSQLDSEAEFQAPEGDSITADSKPTKEAATPAEREAEVRDLEANIKDHFAEGWRNIQISVAARALYLSQEQRNNLLLEQEEKLRAELEMYRQRKMSHITAEYEDKAAENQRSTLLSRLYGLTGNVKIPLIVDMLNRWLNDPTKGKLCIFAHHLSVLDAIQDQASISNEEGSNRKFIRIDGSTLPKQRQQHIKDFQTDPSVRIALLGITAAGVAVTLTASSAVWFAELFWTPALMIQAEDRCHRIGQQARVNCLYFVAKGTLDEVLWKLIEKKFQELGEFVEGKEKLKIVVEKEYTHLKDLYSIFQSNDDMDDEGVRNDDEFDDSIDRDFQLDNDLLHEIEHLGEEERLMLELGTDSDDEDADQQKDSKPSAFAVEESTTMPNAGGEDEPITLLDSDDEDAPPAKAIADENSGMNHGTALAAPLYPSSDPTSEQLTGCRLYRIFVSGPKLGLELSWYKGRVVVSLALNITDCDGIARVRPKIGDILVCVGGTPIPMVPTAEYFRCVIQHVKKRMMEPPVELRFAEDKGFGVYYEACVKQNQQKKKEAIENRNKENANQVIELE